MSTIQLGALNVQPQTIAREMFTTSYAISTSQPHENPPKVPKSAKYVSNLIYMLLRSVKNWTAASDTLFVALSSKA